MIEYSKINCGSQPIKHQLQETQCQYQYKAPSTPCYKKHNSINIKQSSTRNTAVSISKRSIKICANESSHQQMITAS